MSNSNDMIWSYGITTIPELQGSKSLKTTIADLKVAGFDRPHLFVDKCDDVQKYVELGFPVTVRSNRLKTFGHWVTSLWELYARNPHANRYILFQDDFLVCPSLQNYLNHCPYPENSYIKLSSGVFVLSRDTVVQLLQHYHISEWAKLPIHGTHLVNKVVTETLQNLGCTEYIHSPNPVPIVPDGLHTEKPTIRVALPAVDTLELTVNCLEHLARTDWPMIIDYVDNGSQPGVLEDVMDIGRELNLTMSSTRWPINKGFTPAVNVSMKKAAQLGQHCLILNNDCMVSPNTIPRLFNMMQENPKIAAAGPLTMDKGAQSLNRTHLQKQAGLSKAPKDADQPEQVSLKLTRHESSEVSRLAFFCTLLRPQAIQTVGLLPIGFEDGLGADDTWCLYARKRGMTCNLVFDAYAHHMHSQTFKSLGIDRRPLSVAAMKKYRALDAHKEQAIAPIVSWRADDEKVMPTATLLFHCWPYGDKWRNHVTLMRQHAKGYDRKIMGVATDSSTSTFQEVKDAFGSDWEYFEVANSKSLQEVATCEKMLDMCVTTDPDAIMVYAHSKGTQSHTADNPNVNSWTNVMYETVVGNIDEICDIMDSGPCIVGSFRRFGKRFRSFRSKYGYHYSGSFYAIRASQLFNNGRRTFQLTKNKYGTESLPGNCVPLELSACIVGDNTGDLYKNNSLPMKDLIKWRESK